MMRLYQTVISCDTNYNSGLWLGSKANPFSFWGPSSAHRSTGWSALYFAREWGGRDIDLKKLQRIVLRCGDPQCMYEFARDVKGANVSRFQYAIIKCGNAKVMRMFAEKIPGANKRYIELMIMIAEVHEN